MRPALVLRDGVSWEAEGGLHGEAQMEETLGRELGDRNRDSLGLYQLP